MPMLILASTSSTRKSLLSGAGLRFTAIAPQVDERALEACGQNQALSPPDLARVLAEAKARDVAAHHPEAFVIGADQVLALGAERFHKPLTLAAARTQLDALRAKTHALHSGVALVRNGDVLWSRTETAMLTMRAFSGAERDAVLKAEGEAVLQSVGAYRLEGPSIRLFERVEGDYFTILGLPLLPLLAALRSHAPALFGD